MDSTDPNQDQILNQMFKSWDNQTDLKEIFQAIADGVVVQDENRRVIFVNAAAAKLMGFSKESEIVNQSIFNAVDKFEIFDENHNPVSFNHLPGKYALEGVEVPAKIVTYRHRDTGEEFWSEIKARAIRDKNGKPRFAVSIFRDITEQKRIQTEYERINRRNQHILESITDGFFALDNSWRFTYINKRAEQLLQKSREELIGKNIFEQFPTALKSETYRKFGEALAHNQALRHEEYFPEGGLWIESSAYPSKDGIAVYLRDITIQKRTAEITGQLASIVESSQDAIIGKTLDGVITSWNKGAERIYGYAAEEVIGKNISIITPNEEENDTVFITDQIRRGEGVDHYHTMRKRKDGKIIHVSVTVSPIRNELGEIIGASTFARDITEEKHSEELLRQSEERFRAMIENSADCIMLLDQQGKITYATCTIEKVLGFSETEIIGTSVFDLMYSEDLPATSELYLKLLSQTGGSINAQYRMLRKDGTCIWAEGVGTNLLHHPNINAVVANFRDISLRKKAEETLQHQYHHDALTDLPNRTYLSKRFEQALTECDLKRNNVALTLIDLDRFKQINESLGHAVGDRLIQEVSLRLRSCIKDNHVLARLGGDEFGILVTDVETEEDVAKLSAKILEDFKTAFYLDSHELYISPSIGISLYPYDGREPATLFKNAEAALYRAKDYGRNNYQFYTTSMNAAAFERLTMESKLRHAIDNNEFVLYYEPQIDISTGKIVGTEELIRWQRPNMSLVPPDRFIPLAEINGLIEPIGEFVLHEALRQGKIWHDNGFKIIMAINLSARQFKQKNFEKLLVDAIEKSGFNPAYLEFELTESVLAENSDVIINIMNGLRERGVRFCLDDFSTGHSSLRYIKQFPVDMLKIERNFMKGIPHDIQNSAIARSILTLGQSLGLEVTAEGVESKNQLGFLRDNLCNRAQGYLFNGALPPHLMTEILHEDRYVSVVASLDKSKPV